MGSTVDLIFEAEFARKVRIEAYTDSTAGKSMTIRFGSSKRTKHEVSLYAKFSASWIVASQEN